MLVGLDSRSNNAARNRNALRGGAALTAGMLFAAGAALPAVAADPPEDRVLIPPEQVSVQLYSLIPWVNDDGQEEVLNRLGEMGFQNVEPYGGNYNGLTAEEFRAQIDAAGLNAPSSHFDVDEDSFDDTLEYVKTVGQEYVGSGGFPSPGIRSYEDTLATAKAMDRLGQLSVDAGVGKFFGHNHAGEFTTVYEHNGTEMSAWEILVTETDSDLVTFEVDVGWAAHAGVDVPALLQEYGDRIELLHIKDATGLGESGSPTFTNLGEGDVPLQEILTEAKEVGVKYFVMEYDLAPDGEDFTATGFEYLTGIPVPDPGGDDGNDDPVHIAPSQVSIQMFSLIPWVSDAGLEPVLERLSEMGFENIEPFGGTFSGYSAEEFRELTDGLGISVPSSHYNVDEDDFDETLDFVAEIGQEYVGSGGFAAPGISSYDDTLATAETMNRLGERSVDAGIGKFFGHNHAGEFTTVYEHNGAEMSAWEILVTQTNPEYVTFQLDVGWASHAGEDVPALLQEYGDRIELLHIKDATELGESDGPNFTNLGEGEVELQAILAAAKQAEIQYYVLEYDFAPDGEDFTATGFEYLTGLEVPAPDPGTPDPDPDPDPEPGEPEPDPEPTPDEPGTPGAGDNGTSPGGDGTGGDDSNGSNAAPGGELPRTGGDLSLLLPVLALILSGVVLLRIRGSKQVDN